MESITSLLSIALGAVLVNNFVLSQFLGICPFMGVSKKVETALGMGMAVIFVMGVASAVKPKDKAEEMAFVAKYGKGISRMLAYTVCRGCVARRVGIGLTAWILRELVDWRFLVAAFHMFERLMGTKDFTRIIRSVDRANPMKPRLSQVGRGS